MRVLGVRHAALDCLLVRRIDDGRFAVAFRQLREGESLEEVMRQVKLATEK